MMPQVNQSKLIHQMNRYLALKGFDLLTEVGHCHGFSLVKSYMEAIGSSKWWKRHLKAISRWNGRENSLQKKVVLTKAGPRKRREKQSLEAIFDKVINDIVFHQLSHRRDVFANALQTDFLDKKHSLFFSATGEIKQSIVMAGCFNSGDLAQLFDENLFCDPDCPTVHTISRLGHTCTFKFDGKKWWFYDPNNARGEQAFRYKSDFIAHVVQQLGDGLVLQVGAFTEGTALKNSNAYRYYQDLLTNKTLQLLQNEGVLLIDQYFSDDFFELFNQVRQDSALDAYIDQLLKIRGIYQSQTFFFLLKYLHQHDEAKFRSQVRMLPAQRPDWLLKDDSKLSILMACLDDIEVRTFFAEVFAYQKREGLSPYLAPYITFFFDALKAAGPDDASGMSTTLFNLLLGEFYDKENLSALDWIFRLAALNVLPASFLEGTIAMFIEETDQLSAFSETQKAEIRILAKDYESTCPELASAMIAYCEPVAAIKTHSAYEENPSCLFYLRADQTLAEMYLPNPYASRP